jgi:hypothetical protein
LTNLFVIDVKKDHIAKGLRGSCYACPVAKSLWDLGYTLVSVDGQHISFKNGAETVIAPTPKPVKDFIRRFDDDLAVQPFTFEIRRNGDSRMAEGFV